MVNGKEFITWTMFDGNTMCGEILQSLYDSYEVRRVDGGICTVPHIKVKGNSTAQDVLKACEFFLKRN